MRVWPIIGATLLVIAPSAYAAPASPCPGSDGSITWKVKGRLAVFRGDVARAAVDRLVEQIAFHNGRLVSDESPTVDSAYQDIVETLVDTSSDPAVAKPLFQQTYWDSARESYIDRDELLRPAQVNVFASFGTLATRCVWTIGSVRQSGTCTNQAIRIARNTTSGRLEAVLMVDGPNNSHGQSCVHVDEKLIIGLGDSYASGEGNPDRPTQWAQVPGVEAAPVVRRRRRGVDSLWDRERRGPLAAAPATADAQWWDNSCHRSLLSQQSLATMSYAAADPHRLVVFLSFACSGATIIDGVIGPRFEAPGVSRLPKTDRPHATSLRLSQLEQALQLLCADRLNHEFNPIPTKLRVWHSLQRPAAPDTERTGHVWLPRCGHLLVTPDALLLSVGGNDIGFGGVGFWAIMPPKDRLWLPTDFIAGSSISTDRAAAKRDFGLVCPFKTSELRCRKSGFTAQDLIAELPGMYELMNTAFARAGLGAVPVKIQMSYPPVALDETGELCGRLWAAPTTLKNEMRNEPWMPLYNEALAKFRVRSFSPLTMIAPWDFGIWNKASLAECQARDTTKAREMCTIYRDVYLPLNRSVATNAKWGWTVVDAARLPSRHGLCAASTTLSAAVSRDDRLQLQTLARAEFGWPRYHDGWIADWPNPLMWKPYLPRARWYRTAVDSALTQTTFDGGTGAAVAVRTPALRLEEATAGTIHPTLEMHAAMAQLVSMELSRLTER